MIPRNYEYFILVNILSELLNVVYVCAELRTPMTVAATYDVSDDMLEVADSVCGDLLFEANSAKFNVTNCIENFLSSEVGLPSVSPPEIQTCHLKGKVAFNLATKDTFWRLVVLVPDDDEVYIQWYLVERDKKTDTIRSPAGNFTIWTVSLNGEGRHSAWLRGPLVTPWKGLDKQYDINMVVEFENGNSVKGVFQWEDNDAQSACYEVRYNCMERIIATDIVWRNKASNKTHWVVRNLPKNEECEFRLSGVRGTTVKEYHISNFLEGLARDVKIWHEEASDGGWDVIVTWTPPIQTPIGYNVTLVKWDDHTSHVLRSVPVPQNETEVVVKNVQAEGYYSILIDSLMGTHTTRTSRSAIFPVHSNLTGLVVAVAVLAAIILFVGVAMCLKKRRADRLKRSYFLDLDDKPSEEVVETFEVESTKTEEYWEVGSRRLLLHEVVGEGAFGVVRRGTLGGEEVAVKMLKDFPTQDEIRSFHAEIELMKLIKTVGRHAHVLNMIECRAGRRPLILSEYCSGGDLLSYLRCIWDVMVSKRKVRYYNNNIEGCEYRNDLFKCNFDSKLVVNKLYELQGICDTELTSRDLLSFCRQIAIGMDFLASNKVVHRDLAARNILVARDRTLKIADFGLSRDVYEENQYKQKGNGKMPVKWMALESLERKIYTTKSDIWSFGVVVWEIVTVGGSPYPDVPPARLLRFLREGYRMQRPNNCSMELYDLMLSCWHAQPSARPSFSELYKRLDELLNSVCAHDYLSLEMNEEVRPVLSKNKYMRMIKEKLGWSRSESYTYPCRATHNHYSSPPAALPALQPA